MVGLRFLVARDPLKRPRRERLKFVFASFIVLVSSAFAVDFNRDVRPILSDTCFRCHGPGVAEADLRLDIREAALSANAFVPGNIEESEVIARIFSSDPDTLMPPPDSHKTLTALQRQILRDWIAEGAEYADHWSFVLPTRNTAITSLDEFIVDKLETVGLGQSPEADRRTLIRRVTLDLTGLPPIPAAIEEFVNDTDPNAFEKVVDRLLASPAYGERMALAWMDLARYGDTSVMHADGPREMWPWRDWVINAYNDNKPFDEFTLEQLAGDLIPNATVDQKVASGFNRNHGTSDEGGAFPEELRVEYVVDRVQTTSNVWLGLTMECSQCHDHKYDPISQEEYYKFYAYFNNTSDPGMQSRRGNQAPLVEVVDEIRQAKLSELKQLIDESQSAIDEYRNDSRPAFGQWLRRATEENHTNSDSVKEPEGLALWFSLDEKSGTKLSNGANGTIAIVEKGKFESVDREGVSTGIKLNGKTQYKTENVPVLEFNQPFSFAGWVKSTSGNGAIFSKMDEGSAFRGFDFWMQGNSVGTHIINTWNSNAIKVVSKAKLANDKWQHVVVTYDGGQKASGVKIYIDGILSDNSVEADTLSATIQTDQPFRIGSRSKSANLKAEVDDLRIYNRVVNESELEAVKGGDPIKSLFAVSSEERTTNQTDVLLTYYLGNHDNQYAKLAKTRASVLKQHADLNQKPTTSMIMQDNPPEQMRMTYILDRGAYDSPRKDQPVEPGVPAALPPLPQSAPNNRLGLAQWLTMPEHPLTARVAVNRYWTMLFGYGLVRTPSDLGAQGALPTHPELLDWLAVDFHESGWNVKRMLKQLVMSRTYRQSSRVESQHDSTDPENYLLARSNRFRLQGEFIRDQSLAVSGLLVNQVGGPGVKPYQPTNIWNEVSLNGGLRYTQDKGDKLYRRSIYTYWKRSAPMPSMLIFDAPTREKCVVQRPRTNTPLQALVTLNDPQFVEASRVFAERLIKEGGSDAASRVDFAYQLTVARPATEREQQILKQLLTKQRDRFNRNSAAANEFLNVGESPRDSSINASEHAAWTVIAQTILNLDEALTRG